MSTGKIRGFMLIAIVVTVASYSFASDAAVQASDAGTLTVTVSDQNGIIPSATIVLANTGTDRVIRGVTDRAGVAIFAALPAGTYDLTVSYQGFADYVQKGIEIAAGSEQAIDAQMVLAQFSKTITISTPNRREQLLRDVAEPTTVITAADLADSGGRSAKDILIEYGGAGVVVTPGGGQGHVAINGVGNKGVLILIDGRRWLGKNGLGEVRLEDLDISQFERIEIVKGAGSAIYGSEAIAGVINFITKKPKTAGVSNTVNLNYGTYQDTRISDSLSFYKGDFRGTVNGSYRFFEGYDLDESNPQTIGLPESTFYSFSTNVEHQVTDRFTWRGIFDYQRREMDKYFFAGPTQLPADTYNSQRETTRLTISPEADYLITDSTVLTARYTYSKYNREESRIYPGRTDVIDPWLEWNSEFNGTIKHSWNAFEQDHFLQLGYEFRNEKMDRASIISPDTGETELERDINVFWAQNELNLNDQFKVTFGFRYDDYSDFGSEFSPKASAMYAVTDEHRIRASYGHGFLAPRFGQLFFDGGFFFQGNPDLEPEKSDNLTFGYTFTGDKGLGSIDYFFNKIKNGIVFDLGVFPYSYKNETEFTAKGFNASVDLNLPGGFTPTASYSYVKREDEDGEEILGFPTHTFFGKLLWTNPRWGLRANIRVQYNDETEFDDGTARPSYQIWYFQANKLVFNSTQYKINAFVQVDNLLDEQDFLLQDSTGNPIVGDFVIWLPPRTFLFGVTINMDFSE